MNCVPAELLGVIFSHLGRPQLSILLVCRRWMDAALRYSWRPCDGQGLILAARYGHVDYFKRHALLGWDASQSYQGALREASISGHADIVLLLLQRPDVHPEHWQSPLVFACQGGHVEVVHLLLKDGRCDAKFALRYAVDQGSEQCVELLLKYGASADHVPKRSLENLRARNATRMLKLLGM